MITFGQLFAVVKFEGLNLCNELKLQAKYGDKSHTRNEMGNFYEAFGIEKIEVPSTKRKRIIKRKGPPKRPFRPRPKPTTQPTPTKPKAKGKAPKKQFKKPIACFKCGKPGHKAFQWKVEQKINEFFAEDAQMKAKLLAVLIQEPNDQSEEDNDYYSDSTESEYESSPLPVINVITNKSQKEFLLDLIGQIPNGDLKKEYLEKLKTLILEEEDKSCKFFLNASTSSLTNIYKQFPIPNPFQQITTKDLQTDINQLKTEIKHLKTEVLNLKTTYLTIEAKLALLQSSPPNTDIPNTIPADINGIPEAEIPTQQFLQTISKITFQKWFSIVTLAVEDFSTNTVALIDSGADVNCIKRGITPTKYCEKTNEGLSSANGTPLTISYKLNKGYIKNDNYCFKNTFLIVDNIISDLILGTPFLTQIYPFYINESGLHTKIMGKTISFNFLTAAKQKEIAHLQSSSIFKQINTIQIKQKLIASLQEEVSYLRIEEQLQNPNIQKKILDFKQIIKTKICADLPNAFWERKQHIITLPYEKGFQ